MNQTQKKVIDCLNKAFHLIFMILVKLKQSLNRLNELFISH
ncbi:MAG: hypothetical protein BAJALOKI3v1_810018 [Promethearchaeota archaeon]|nr:MAG: hypothetical protein BAJALOKI3v1_810018 [Candidatus Lokiarchaeota archaeon]